MNRHSYRILSFDGLHLLVGGARGGGGGNCRTALRPFGPLEPVAPASATVGEPSPLVRPLGGGEAARQGTVGAAFDE
jgi:hypothetical protein